MSLHRQLIAEGSSKLASVRCFDCVGCYEKMIHHSIIGSFWRRWRRRRRSCRRRSCCRCRRAQGGGEEGRREGQPFVRPFDLMFNLRLVFQEESDDDMGFGLFD